MSAVFRKDNKPVTVNYRLVNTSHTSVYRKLFEHVIVMDCHE